MHPHPTNSSFVVVKKNDVTVIFLPFLFFSVPGRSIFFKRHVIASTSLWPRGGCSISKQPQNSLCDRGCSEAADECVGGGGKDILSSFFLISSSHHFFRENDGCFLQ